MPITRTALCTFIEPNNGITKIMLAVNGAEPEVFLFNLALKPNEIELRRGVEYEITIRRAGWKERRDG